VHGVSAHASAPNLHFVGFVDPRSGQLRELRLQAERIARLIAPTG
jgi:putative flavoprotein involved in K+ transport